MSEGNTVVAEQAGPTQQVQQAFYTLLKASEDFRGTAADHRVISQAAEDIAKELGISVPAPNSGNQNN